MPRIAKPPTPEVESARKALVDYLATTGRSLNSLANELDVRQSTLYRFVVGRTKSITPKVRPALDYVHKLAIPCIIQREGVSDNADLHELLRRSWPDRPDAADVLAKLIDAIGPIIAQHCNPDRSTGKTK